MLKTYAQISPTELSALFTILAGMLVGFYALVRYMLDKQENAQNSAKEVQKLDREERMALTKAFTRVAEATEQAAREAKERNGHLAELTLQSQEMYQKLADRNFEAITNIKEQHVAHQVVESETVASKKGAL